MRTECPACKRSVGLYPQSQMHVHRPYSNIDKAPPEQIGLDCVGSGRTVERTNQVMSNREKVDSGRTWVPSR